MVASVDKKSEYSVQIFEIGRDMKKTMTFSIHPSLIVEYLGTWRRLSKEDYNNNLFFFPEMSKKRASNTRL